ncbi:hypothetical protein [Nocardioides koreensis]
MGPLVTGLVGTPAMAAVAKPSGLTSQSSVTAVVLSWKPVKGAISYHVQVASSSSYDSPVLDVLTTNTHATPTAVVPFGKVYWRVAATRGSGWSKWSSASFNRSQRSGPILTEPADGADLDQPEHPPVLRWDPVPGARSYVVEIDGEERDWVDTETYTTETTSLVPTETQQPGTYWWRVRAYFDSAINSLPSTERSYTIGALPRVGLKATEPTMEDVVLQWDPVPGAVDYEVRVSTDNGFNVITDHQYVSGTRYSPPTTYDNASYWWQVRARDVFGQTEEWPVYPDRTGVFQRSWPEKPSLVTPATGSTPPNTDLTFQWTPVPHAAWYLLDVGTDPGFSSGATFKTCKSTQTTYTPGWSKQGLYDNRCMPTKAGTWYWRVRAMDSNTSAYTTVNGRFSEVGSFSWTPPTLTSASPGEVTGERLVLEGNGVGPCTASLGVSGGVCSGVTSTPMLDWDPAPGATSYIVYLAHDRNFTNMVDGFGDVGNPDTMFHTTNTRFMPPSFALPDTQAGEAYYWFIRPCGTGCGLTPEEASNAFQKKSAPVALVSPADNAVLADQATFDWTDYLATNKVTTDPATGEHPTQAARSYRIQVSQNSSFVVTRTDKVYEAIVDQTTFTAYKNSYPEGVLYWRVQAIDGTGNPLTWSPVRQFTKSSPTPVVTSPTDGAVVNGVQPFRWHPLTYAHYYDLEVYRNSDTTASAGNLALKVTNIRQAAYTASKPLQALGKDFVWRVRRTDYDGHAGAWGPWQRFRVTSGRPKLLQPGSTVSRTRAIFSWRAAPQAAYYRWELRRGSTVEQYATTAQTSYAPVRPLTKGKYSWRVISFDSQNHVLRATGWRKVTAK